MIRCNLGKHRVWASILAVAVGMALVVAACETPLPQDEALELSVAAAEEDASGRLATAVESGWITQEWADGIAARLGALGERLRAGVGERGLTEEEARARYFRAELDMVGRAIRTRVGAGEMTVEEGRAAYGGYRELMGEAAREAERASGDRSGDRERLAAARAELARAVEAGEITGEEAAARWDALMERVGRERTGR